MQSEVPQEVFSYIDKQRLDGKDQSATEWLTRLGVAEPRSVNTEYAWSRNRDPAVVCTIWAEFVQIDRHGRWYVRERLEADTKLGGGERSTNQKRRAQNRINLLRPTEGSSKTVVALLQINKTSIEELKQNENAETIVRVKDEEHWQVVGWDESKKEAWLVRGAAPWLPSLDEPTAEPPPVDESRASPGENESNFGFPDYETRKRIEDAAVAHVRQHYQGLGYRVDSKETQNVGYDLEVTDSSTGEIVGRVEVKGTSQQVPAFYITRNERATAKALDVWKLAIVTNAIDEPTLQILSADEMEADFEFTEIAWRCLPR
ncbi:DUF3883 domain-containing protein [Ralstonia chuxiongensis]|uniref:DUF3883 domain-containing protein n=1 Tax=Ralstonia chuxiongensis TaxID=2957504 RepID=UPI0028F6B6DF|nr:DUF3883 domain-containing protein [Ralstonia chuxiongensis]CAJ0776402.1 hypothetical protein R8510_04237 [Ralstonia chuxiongensis]